MSLKKINIGGVDYDIGGSGGSGVQSDFAENDSTQDSYIKNRPDKLVVGDEDEEFEALIPRDADTLGGRYTADDLDDIPHFNTVTTEEGAVIVKVDADTLGGHDASEFSRIDDENVSPNTTFSSEKITSLTPTLPDDIVKRANEGDEFTPNIQFKDADKLGGLDASEYALNTDLISKQDKLKTKDITFTLSNYTAATAGNGWYYVSANTRTLLGEEYLKILAAQIIGWNIVANIMLDSGDANTYLLFPTNDISGKTIKVRFLYI